MFEELLTYCHEQIWMRRRELLTGSELYIAGAIGIAALVLGPEVAVGRAKLGDVLTVVLAYAAVAFGFCVAGLTVSLTLPDINFTRLLAVFRLPEPAGNGWRAKLRRRRYRRMQKRSLRGNPVEPNAYSDLLFVFSWTALAHWIAIVWGCGVFVACGSDAQFLPKHPIGARISDAVLVALLAYAALQFLLTLLTISGVGSVYIATLRRGEDDRAEPEADDRPDAEYDAADRCASNGSAVVLPKARDPRRGGPAAGHGFVR
jgi:hypothetical protein